MPEAITKIVRRSEAENYALKDTSFARGWQNSIRVTLTLRSLQVNCAVALDRQTLGGAYPRQGLTF